jgi:phosphoribosylformylglycinamidine synthase
VAVTDCLNFGSPEKPDGYYQLAECIEGMSEACETFGTPVVSGNVSLYNETDRGPIYPTPTVGMVGIFDDVNQYATPAFKRKGDIVVIIGGPPERQPKGNPLAGSSYLEIVQGKVAGVPISPDLVAEKQTSDLVRSMIRSGLIDTAHDLSGGGELVALAEMAVAGGMGFDCDESEIRAMQDYGHPLDILLGEGGASFLIAFTPERWDEVQDALAGFAYDEIGVTGGDKFRIDGFVDLSLEELRQSYERDLFEAHAPEGGHIG